MLPESELDFDGATQSEIDDTLSAIVALRSELGLPGGCDAPAAAASTAEEERETMIGHFVIQDQSHGGGLLGQGGQANFEKGEGGVFLGRHNLTGELVAVKKLHYAVLRSNPQNFERLKREALNAWRITHPNVTKLKVMNTKT